YTDLTTNSFTLAPANPAYTNPTGDLRIIDGTATGVAATYTANTTVGSLLMVAPTFSTTLAINAATTLTVDSGNGTLGAIAVGSSALSLTLGNSVNQGVITAGTTAADSSLALINLNPTSTITVNSVIADNDAGGAVTLDATGSVILRGHNTYTGNTSISNGTLQLANAGSLGAGNYAGDIANNGTLRASSVTNQTLSGIISGSGGILKDTSPSILTLTGANTYEGDTTLSSGIINIQNSTALGSVFGGTTVANLTALELQNNIAVGAESLNLSGTGVGGAGALRNISGDNSWGGDIAMDTPTVRINSDAGTLTIAGDIDTVANTNLLTIGGAGNTTVTGVISRSGALTKDGTGVLVLAGDNTYTGATNVTAGSLYVNGDQPGALGLTTVASGATLGGTGTIGGDVTIANGATFAPGGNTSAPGTLSINGNLSLGGTSTLEYSFGQANSPGGPLNDLTNVGGNLTLGGTINITQSPGGTFGPGLYRIFNYTGALTNNGLTLGTTPVPAANLLVQTSVANQVNLINTSGLTFNFWDAAVPKNNNLVDGGDGVWQNAGTLENWTDSAGAINASYTDGAFAIFQGAPGTVTVDTSLGAVNSGGMQFAVDGYTITGDPLTLIGGMATIRVGDGTAAGAAMTATISSILVGSTTLVKSDLGTLVLEGANTYTGGTAIDGGTLAISSDANLGDAAGGVSFDDGTLKTLAGLSSNRAITLQAGGGTVNTNGFNSSLGGVISGAGRLTINGGGVATLTGTNTYTGGTNVVGATVAVSANNNLGAASGSLTLNNGTLLTLAGLTSSRNMILNVGGGTVATNGLNSSFDGAISGAGLLTINGGGVVTLDGTSSYTGGTNVTGSTVAVSANNNLGASSGSLTLDNGTLLTLAGFTSSRDVVLNAGGGTVNTNGFNSVQS
ncbi:MAG TPA: autotransporter-associated beta strand repeat-containing protein, partial [Luteolibacter sp.]